MFPYALYVIAHDHWPTDSATHMMVVMDVILRIRPPKKCNRQNVSNYTTTERKIWAGGL